MKTCLPLVLIPFDGSVSAVLANARRSKAVVDCDEIGVVLGEGDVAEAVASGSTPMTIEQAVAAMAERDEVTLIVNTGTMGQRAPLLLAAANLPHVHVIEVQGDEVTVLRASVRDAVEAVLAHTKTIRELTERRAAAIKGLLARAELIESGRRLIPDCDPGGVMCHFRYQYKGDMTDAGLVVKDWRGGDIPPGDKNDLRYLFERSRFLINGASPMGRKVAIIVGREVEQPTEVHFLDPDHDLER